MKESCDAKPCAENGTARRMSTLGGLLLVPLFVLAAGLVLGVIVAWPPLGLSLLLGMIALVFMAAGGGVAVSGVVKKSREILS